MKKPCLKRRVKSGARQRALQKARDAAFVEGWQAGYQSASQVVAAMSITAKAGTSLDACLTNLNKMQVIMAEYARREPGDTSLFVIPVLADAIPETWQ